MNDKRKRSIWWSKVVGSAPSARHPGWTFIELECGHMCDVMMGQYPQIPIDMRCWPCEKEFKEEQRELENSNRANIA